MQTVVLFAGRTQSLVKQMANRITHGRIADSDDTEEATDAGGRIQADGNAREARTRRGEREEDKKMRSGAGGQRGAEEDGRETVKADRNSNPRTPPQPPRTGSPSISRRMRRSWSRASEESGRYQSWNKA